MVIPKEITDFAKAAEAAKEIIWDKCLQAEVHFLRSMLHTVEF